ncbi:MAG: hypothetical protein GX558_07805 [Clostridiales bacterium]|nr:hypothetical protein [Clostridiales bacterium]
MAGCSFCGRKSARPLRIGNLVLCDACEKQLTQIDPDDARYRWYLNAMRRALLGDMQLPAGADARDRRATQ